MKCQNCGNEISKDDIFCQNCGWKIERNVNDTQNVEEKKNDIKQTDKRNEEVGKSSIKVSKNKKNWKIILGIVLGVFAIVIAVICILSSPKDVEIEAKELIKLINDGNAKQYYSDNLYVHGYVVRDNREFLKKEDDKYYILVSDIDDLENTTDILLFIYEKGLDDNLGTGSEVIVQGKLRENDNESIELLIGENIEIKKKVDPVYTITFEQLNDAKYIDKQIKISGRMIDSIGDGHFLVDSDINHAIQLMGITDAEFANYFKDGSLAIVTGILKEDGTIDVDKISQDEFTKKESYDHGVSVQECYSHNLVDSGEITIHGIYIRNGSYSVPYSIQDEETGQFISISIPNESVDLDKYFESGQKCVISGYLSMGGTGYILTITTIG